MTTPFGHEMRELFCFAQGYRNLNHGSFGTFPNIVKEAKFKELEELEARPDIYLRYTFPTILKKAREAVAKMLNVPTSECVLIENATLGVNTVLRNLTYKPNDVIIYFETTYGGCAKTALSVQESLGPQVHKIDVNYLEEGQDDIINNFRKEIKMLKQKGLNPNVAIIDTIVSMPSARVPFEDMIKVCKEEQVYSLIDGAHGIGHIHLDLKKLDPDFFVSNLYKWLFVPRGSAVLQVPERNQGLIRTSFPTSHGYVPVQEQQPLVRKNPTPFEALFASVATIDVSSYASVPAAIEFREKVCGGEEKIISYCSKLAFEGGNKVAQILGTKALDNKPGSTGSHLRDCNLTQVIVPLEIGKDIDEDDINNVCRWMEQQMIDHYNTYLVIIPYRGKLWTRLSGQIYLDESDFEFAGNMLKELCEKVKQGLFKN